MILQTGSNFRKGYFVLMMTAHADSLRRVRSSIATKVCSIITAAAHPDDLPYVLWRHILLRRLHIAKLPLVSISFGVQLLPLACLQIGHIALCFRGPSGKPGCSKIK